MAQATETPAAEAAAASNGQTGANGNSKAHTNGKRGRPAGKKGASAGLKAPDALFAAASTSLPVGAGYADVALAALCQSYAHALSIAFQEAVLNQQRRATLAQAAVARAVSEIADVAPDQFEGRLAQMTQALDMLGLSGKAELAAYAEMTQQFNDAASQLMEVRAKAGV